MNVNASERRYASTCVNTVKIGRECILNRHN